MGNLSEHQPYTITWSHRKEMQVQKPKRPYRALWPSPGMDTQRPKTTEHTTKLLEGRHTAVLIQPKSVQVTSSALGHCHNIKDNTSYFVFILKATNKSLHHRHFYAIYASNLFLMESALLYVDAVISLLSLEVFPKLFFQLLLMRPSLEISLMVFAALFFIPHTGRTPSSTFTVDLFFIFFGLPSLLPPTCKQFKENSFWLREAKEWSRG